MLGRGLIKVKEIYDFICPEVDYKDWENKISKTSILIADNGIICLDLFSASKLMDEYIKMGRD